MHYIALLMKQFLHMHEQDDIKLVTLAKVTSGPLRLIPLKPLKQEIVQFRYKWHNTL